MRGDDRPPKAEWLLRVAQVTSMLSTCARLQVGIAISDAEMQSFWVGYNGGPKGGPNSCRHDEAGRCGCVHAEANAVIKAPGDIDKRAFSTHSPCTTCAVMLVNANVRDFYYLERYRDDDGLDVLIENGVMVVQYKVEELTLPAVPHFILVGDAA